MVVSFLIVLIGIGAGPVLFGRVGYSIDDSKEITSLEAASLTIQTLVAVVVIQLTLALKKSEKIEENKK